MVKIWFDPLLIDFPLALTRYLDILENILSRLYLGGSAIYRYWFSTISKLNLSPNFLELHPKKEPVQILQILAIAHMGSYYGLIRLQDKFFNLLSWNMCTGSVKTVHGKKNYQHDRQCNNYMFADLQPCRWLSSQICPSLFFLWSNIFTKE